MIGILRTIRNIILTALSPFGRKFHPGHYYSPLPDIHEVERVLRASPPIPKSLPGIEFNDDAQLRLLTQLAKYSASLPYVFGSHSDLRYYSPNGYYPMGDAALLIAFLRHFQTERVVEIGSGFSSAVMLDANELYFGNSLNLTIIDPFTQRLQELWRPGDFERLHILKEPVQRTPLQVFDELGAGDILFVDSSHTAKFGSDVNFLLFQVLPRLKKGVLIHFHDIYWPFEYPWEVFHQGIAWNENYLLHAFLQFNNHFTPLLFIHYLLHNYREAVNRAIPACVQYGGVSLWLRAAE